MSENFAGVFDKLRSILTKYADRLAVTADIAGEYALVTKTASPFPQHKGQPLHFGSVRVGKAYVSFHLMPIYMSPGLTKSISPALKKRMQGKSCFNFKSIPEPELIAELSRLVESGFRDWRDQGWV